MYFYMKVKWIVNPSKQNKQASPPSSPDKLDNFFSDSEMSLLFNCKSSCSHGKDLTWEIFCSKFSLLPAFLISKQKDVMVSLSSRSKNPQKDG